MVGRALDSRPDSEQTGAGKRAQFECTGHRHSSGPQAPAGAVRNAEFTAQTPRRRLAPHEEVMNRLNTIPGVNRLTASTLIAELGVQMQQFPDALHLASWAGLFPGNCESAGKRKKTRTRKGNPQVRRVLCQAAWAASRNPSMVEPAEGAGMHPCRWTRGRMKSLMPANTSTGVIEVRSF